MLHLATENESGINVGMRRLGRDVIELAFADLDSPNLKDRREAENFFNPYSGASSLPVWAIAAELDLDSIRAKARKIIGGNYA